MFGGGAMGAMLISGGMMFSCGMGGAPGKGVDSYGGGLGGESDLGYPIPGTLLPDTDTPGMFGASCHGGGGRAMVPPAGWGAGSGGPVVWGPGSGWPKMAWPMFVPISFPAPHKPCIVCGLYIAGTCLFAFIIILSAEPGNPGTFGSY